MKHIRWAAFVILAAGLLGACAQPAGLDEDVDAGSVTGIDEPLLPASDDEEAGPTASGETLDEDQEQAPGVTQRSQGRDDDEMEDELDDDDLDDDGPRTCPQGWQARIEQADVGSDPLLCGLPRGICANIARGKPVPPGIRRNAEACGIDVDALVSQLAG